MTSAAKIAANRVNAQKSTGPRSAAAKARTRYNAFQHGLSSPATFDQRAAARLNELRNELFLDALDPARRESATVAAEAQAEIECVRQVKVDLINQSAKRVASCHDHGLAASELAALAFAERVEVVAACDRYEKRALARRKRALRAYNDLHAAELRADSAERVGPPLAQQRRIKDRDNLFNENCSTLDLGEVMRLLTKGKPRACGTPVNWDARGTWEWRTNEQAVASMQVSVRLEGDRALLTLEGRAWGQEIRQEVVVVRTPTKVGGVMWSVACPETGKAVRYLYLVRGQRQFRTRHALRLTYRSNNLKQSERYFKRVFRLMERLGGGDPEFMPPRPKNMRRDTYKCLRSEIAYAHMHAWCAGCDEVGLGRIKCP